MIFWTIDPIINPVANLWQSCNREAIKTNSCVLILVREKPLHPANNDLHVSLIAHDHENNIHK